MKVLGLGLDLKGNPIYAPATEMDFAKQLKDSLSRNAKWILPTTRATSTSIAYKGEIKRKTKDRGDPRAAGWTYLVNANDPQRHDIEPVIRPLARHRGMDRPESPLLYNGETEDDWFDWLHQNYLASELEGRKPPEYVLIVGSPAQVPFRFQSLLDTMASVGRVDFDRMDELKQYVDKLLRLDAAAQPVTSAEAVFFATDAGVRDPTFYSRKYMAEPLADNVSNELKVPVKRLMGEQASKACLLSALEGQSPALVYTASHGLLARGESLEIQKRFNGAICCQAPGDLTRDDFLAAEDVPSNKPFLDGSIVFQFACFGGGTPAQSEFAHWLNGVPETYAAEDFTAALPKRLLSLPFGPKAFIGHLDTAFLHAFDDPSAPATIARWNERIVPFLSAVNSLLGVEPAGLAMEEMNRRFGYCNAVISNTYDLERRGKLKWTDESTRRFLDMWITRSDAQNYMISGDPAAGLRIATGDR